MKTTTAVIIVLIVAVAGIAAWKYGVFNNPSPAGNNSSSTDTTGATANGNSTSTVSASTTVDIGVNIPKTVTVTYTSAGFSPSSININKGDTVKWVNNTSGQMWVASAVHPSHKVYSGTELSAHCPDTTGTAFDECTGSGPGSTFSFTFGKAGSWGYHDHLHASKGGNVTVQ
jgi:plastocyanin